MASSIKKKKKIAGQQHFVEINFKNWILKIYTKYKVLWVLKKKKKSFSN